MPLAVNLQQGWIFILPGGWTQCSLEVPSNPRDSVILDRDTLTPQSPLLCDNSIIQKKKVIKKRPTANIIYVGLWISTGKCLGVHISKKKRPPEYK